MSGLSTVLDYLSLIKYAPDITKLDRIQISNY